MVAVLSSLSCGLVLGGFIGGASGIAHTVTISDAAVWTVGIGVTYPDMSITKGDALKFISSTHHDVVLMHTPSSGTHWDQCGENGISSGASTTIWSAKDFNLLPLVEKHYTPPTCGDYYIACSILAHCMYMQRVKVTVVNADGSACASPCVDSACVTTDSKRDATSTLHDVKPAANSQYWGQAPYDALVVNIGDTVLFKTSPGYHDVATVPSVAAFDGCDMSSATVVAAWNPMETIPSSTCASSSMCCGGSSCGSGDYGAVTYTFTAKAAGDVYFVCSVGGGSHCIEGQKFRLTVSPDDLANGASRFEVYLLLVALGFIGLA